MLLIPVYVIVSCMLVRPPVRRFAGPTFVSSRLVRGSHFMLTGGDTFFNSTNAQSGGNSKKMKEFIAILVIGTEILVAIMTMWYYTPQS